MLYSGVLDSALCKKLHLPYFSITGDILEDTEKLRYLLDIMWKISIPASLY